MHDFGRRTWSRRKDPANARWAQDRIMSRAQDGLTFIFNVIMVIKAKVPQNTKMAKTRENLIQNKHSEKTDL